MIFPAPFSRIEVIQRPHTILHKLEYQVLPKQSVVGVVYSSLHFHLGKYHVTTTLDVLSIYMEVDSTVDFLVQYVHTLHHTMKVYKRIKKPNII